MALGTEKGQDREHTTGAGTRDETHSSAVGILLL